MDYLEYLQTLCILLPSGAGVILPVDWLRAQLDVDGPRTPIDSAEVDARPAADLTVPEVGEIVGRKPGTVRTWIRSGLNGIRMEAYRFTAKEYRITRQSLEAFLEAQREAGKLLSAPNGVRSSRSGPSGPSTSDLRAAPGRREASSNPSRTSRGVKRGDVDLSSWRARLPRAR